MQIFFNCNVDLNHHHIRKLLSQSERDFLALTNLPENFLANCNIYIISSPQHPKSSNPAITCNAESFYSGVIFLDISPHQPIKQAELRQVIFHELTHIMRGILAKAADNTSLLQIAIEEGIALFVEQQAQNKFHCQFPAYSQIPKIEQKLALKGLKQASKIDRQHLNWNYEEWFYNFDRQNPALPKNFAYAIGKFIVEDFYQTIQLPISEFLQLPMIDFIRHAEFLEEKK